MRGFSNLNPRVLAIYFMSVLLISMFLWHPVIQIISLAGSLLFLSSLSDAKHFISDMCFYMVLFLLISITNPLFSHNGETPLFFMNGNPITLEAILYGGAIGMMIISVIAWCKCFSKIFTTDKILYIFGGLAPKLSLILSMSLRFIPLFKNQAKKVSNAQKTMGLYCQESKTDKAKSAMSTLSVLTGWSLENAVDTGNAMRARGYGLKPRTNYSIFRFRLSDGFFTATVIVLTVLTLIPVAFGSLNFAFYPAMSPVNCSALSLSAYICYGILAILPFIIETEENIKWKYYISGI